MKPKQRSWLNISTLALAIGWLVLISLTIAPDVSDFQDYWQGIDDLWRYGDPYVTQPGYIYPPLFAYIIQPFGLITHEQGQPIWYALNLLSLVAFVPLCIWISGSSLVQRYWGVAVLGAVLVPPTRLSLQLGQISIMLALLLVGNFALSRRHSVAAGFLLALAGLVKLYPAIAGIHYLLHPPRRVVMWSAIMVGVLLALTVPIYGVGHYEHYLYLLLEGNYSYASEHTVSLYGYWVRMFAPSRFAIPLLNARFLAIGLSLVMGVALIWLGIRVSHLHVDDLGLLLQFSYWLAAMMLIWPANGYYNLVQLLLPVLVIVRWLEHHPDRTVRAWLVIAVALICVPPSWSNFNPTLYQFTHIGWGTLVLTPSVHGLFILTLLLAWLAHQAGVQTPQEAQPA